MAAKVDQAQADNPSAPEAMEVEDVPTEMTSMKADLTDEDDVATKPEAVPPWSYTVHPDTEARTAEEIRSYLEEHEVTVEGPDAPKPVLKMEETGLPDDVLARAKEVFGEDKLSPSSCCGLPVVLGARHLFSLGEVSTAEQAPTFVPYVVMHCMDRKKAGVLGPHALVVANSCRDVRELYKYFRDVGNSLGIESLEISEETSNYRGDFESEFHVAVGTPGSLERVQTGKYFSFGDVRWVVACGIDRLLDDGHALVLERLVSATHRSSQVVATSRTWPSDVAGFAEKLVRDPPETPRGPVSPEPVVVRRGAVEESPVPAELKLHFRVLNDESKKKSELVDLVEKFRKEDGDAKTVVVVKTRRKVRNVKKWTDSKTFPSVGLSSGSGRKSSGREAELRDFKSGKSKLAVVMPATLRDLGPQAVKRMVVYDFPSSLQEFVCLVRRSKSVFDVEEVHVFFTHFMARRAQEVLDFLAATGREPEPELEKLAKWAADAQEGRGPPLPTNKLGRHGEEDDGDDDDDRGRSRSRSRGRSHSRSRSRSPDDRSRSHRSNRRGSRSRWSSSTDDRDGNRFGDRGPRGRGGFGGRGRGRGAGFGGRRDDFNGGFGGGRGGRGFGDRDRGFGDRGRGFGGGRGRGFGDRGFEDRGSRFGDEDDGRGGYGDGGRGFRDRGRGFGGRGGGYAGRGGGDRGREYEERGGGYNERGGGYEEAGRGREEGRFGSRRGGNRFGDRESDGDGGSGSTGGGFGERGRGFGNRGRGLGDAGRFADRDSGGRGRDESYGGRQGESRYGDHRPSQQRGGYGGDRSSAQTTGQSRQTAGQSQQTAGLSQQTAGQSQQTAGSYGWNQQQGSAAGESTGGSSYFSSYQQVPKSNLATAFGQYNPTGQPQAAGVYSSFPRQPGGQSGDATGASYASYPQYGAQPSYAAPVRPQQTAYPAGAAGQGYVTSAQGSSTGYRTAEQKGVQPGAYGAPGNGYGTQAGSGRYYQAGAQ